VTKLEEWSTPVTDSKVFRLPDLGEGLLDAEIVRWLVGVGDAVATDQPLVEVETAKAVVELPSPFAGVVEALHCAAAELVPVGSDLVTIGVVAAAGPAAAGPVAAGLAGPAVPGSDAVAAVGGPGAGQALIGFGSAVASRPVAVAVAAAAAGGRRWRGRAPVEALPSQRDPAAADGRRAPVRPDAPRVISPIVRRLAQDNCLDLATVPATGDGGVVRRRDVEAAARAASTRADALGLPGGAATAAATGDERASSAEIVARPSAPGPESERIPLRGRRRVIAERMTRSRREIPEATAWLDVDATGLLEARDAINAHNPEAQVSILGLLARFCAAGLQRYRELNATIDTERGEIVRFSHVHLGFATHTDQGLVVPVIRNAENLTAAAVTVELRALAARAREGTLAPAELTGGTFTINNHGVLGTDGATPIINFPEAAQLAVGRIIDKPWVVDGELRVRKITQLTLAFDHRVCDGGPASGFLRFVSRCVERPLAILGEL
jgi:2-oxoisovalerate dehydrogenase E2 component (dihydrolipoyl transacylase)